MTELSEYNLYYNGRIEKLSDGREYLERDLLNHIESEYDVYHTVKEGERIEQIAYNYYKDVTTNPHLYWKYIADVNKIVEPIDLSEYVGLQIIIPDFRKMQIQE